MNRLLTPILWALAPALVLTPALTCVAPRIMAPMFILSGLAAVIVHAYQTKTKPAFDRGIGAILGGLILFGVISQLWTINPDQTLGKAGQLALVFGVLALMVPVLRSLNADELRRIGYLLVGGMVLGSGVYIAEMHSNFVLYGLTHSPDNNDVADVKQNKASVLIALWFFLTAPFFLLKNKVQWQRFAFLALTAVAFYVTFGSKSNTAQIIFGLTPFFVLTLWVLPARVAMVLALICTVGLTIAMPFGARYVFNNTDWQHNGALNSSLRSRIEIWNQASSRAMEKPILGWGLDASPKLPNRDDVSVLYPDVPRVAHLHPHNAPVQIWFELGAIGIAAVCAFFVLMYQRLARTGRPIAQKYGVFAGSMMFLYTLSIWGIWQTWFIALLCFCGLMAYAGVRHLSQD